MMLIRSFALIEDDRATMLHIRHDGDVTVFDCDRSTPLRCRVEMDGTESKWVLLSRVCDGIAQHEDVLVRIDRLVERVQTGWRPVAEEIDPDIPQRTMLRATFAVDLLAYPDEPDLMQYSRATKLLGRDEEGAVCSTGEILWIASDLSWALCADGFYWWEGS
jgi:hypothetical protein